MQSTTVHHLPRVTGCPTRGYGLILTRMHVSIGACAVDSVRDVFGTWWRCVESNLVHAVKLTGSSQAESLRWSLCRGQGEGRKRMHFPELGHAASNCEVALSLLKMAEPVMRAPVQLRREAEVLNS